MKVLKHLFHLIVLLQRQIILTLYIVYKINLWSSTESADFALEIFLVGAVKMIDCWTDPDSYKYSDYGSWFDVQESFLLSGISGFGKTG